MTRTRIGKGIYRTPYGFAVIWPEAGRNREKHFAADTPIPTLTAYRKQQVKTARPAPSATNRGSFARDVVRYLRTRKGRSCYASERSHLKAWLPRFGRGGRHAITPEAIRLQIADWAGKSARTIRHRLNVLAQVFQLLDPGHPMPCDRTRVKRPALSKVRPKGVPDDLIETVALRLAEQERKGRLRDGKTRARFLVLATCGKRPCQMMRATPIDVNFTTRIWDVAPAKNSLGGPLWLNDEMLAAWRAFDQAEAWGSYDPVSFAKTLRRNGWPTGVRPYRMRHQTLQTMNSKGVDFGAIQQAAGHESPETTRRNYVPHELATSVATSQAIEGRFSSTAFAETYRHRTGLRVGGASLPEIAAAKGGLPRTTKDYQGPQAEPEGRERPDPPPSSRAPQTPRATKTTKDDYQGSSQRAVEISGMLRNFAPAQTGAMRPRLVRPPAKTG